MLHACFTPIALCFVYTSWHFYAFSRTNLLIRCHSATSCFLLLFYSRFLPKKIFSELDETKPKVPILLTRRRSPKGRRRRAGRQPHHGVAQVPLGRATIWCGPLGCPLTLPFCLTKNPKKNQPPSTKSSTVPPPSKTNFGGQKSLFWHPAGTGN
jgi:hypothetical protein